MGPTPSRTSSPTLASKSACRGARGSRRVRGDFPVQLATSRTRTTILADLSADLSDTRAFPRDSRGCPLGMGACTRVNVYYTRYAVVYTFTKLHDRCISEVRVGVGPVEFQLNAAWMTTLRYYVLLLITRCNGNGSDSTHRRRFQLFSRICQVAPLRCESNTWFTGPT